MPNVYQVFALSADYDAFILSDEVLETILSSIFKFIQHGLQWMQLII